MVSGLAYRHAGGARQPGPPPYDEAANARFDLQRALDRAKAADLPLLVIFGANWCSDCRALDRSLSAAANVGPMARDFVTLKVDVGRFNRNLDISARYGNPIRAGIPAAVVVSPDDELLYVTRAGELSSARRTGDAGVHEFFRKVSRAGRAGVRPADR